MDKQHIEITAGDGGAAVHALTGDLTINNTYLNESGYTEQEIQDKENQYLGWVFENCGGLEWLSLMELKDGQGGFSLDAVYTALLSKSRQDDEERISMGISDDHRSIRQGRLSVVELLNKEQKLVLLGDPGSGKSAFVDFVSLCMAGQSLHKNINLAFLTEPLPDQDGKPQTREVGTEVGDEEEVETLLIHQCWEHGVLIPFKIILRDFATSKHFPKDDEEPTAKHFLSFIKQELKTNCIDGYFKILKSRLEKGQVLMMFDGLDEVAQAGDRRKRLVKCIDKFSQSYSKSRFLVTCRPYAYRDPGWQLPRFASDELAEFEDGQIIRFIERWYQQMPSKDREKIVARGQQLQSAILSRPALRDLAKRPLLLSLIAYLHAHRHGLPDRRADLYEKLMDLLLDKWEKARFDINDDDIGQARQLSQDSLAEYLQMGKDTILNVLKRLAFEAHASQNGEEDTADISGKDLHGQLLEAALDRENKKVRPLELAEHLRDRVGILYQRSGSSEKDAVYTFPHRSFQEYLAAEYFRREDGVMFERFESENFTFEEYTWQELAAKLSRTDPDRWREVVVLSGGIHSESDSGSVWNLLKELSKHQDISALTREEAWGLRLASEILAESANMKDMNPRQKGIFNKIQKALPDILATEHLPEKERLKVGEYLGLIGDPRKELLEVDSIKLCKVPKGAFWMGSGGCDDNDKESPLGKLYLDYDFWVAQYPVTVSQFKTFVSQSNIVLQDASALIGGINSPVVWVTQVEAEAFCQWLTARWKRENLLPNGWEVGLPNELEWEKAARGGFEVPSLIKVDSIDQIIKGDQVLTFTDNTAPMREFPFINDKGETRLSSRGLATYGVYPSEASPYGCLDLSGNIGEWTRTDISEFLFSLSKENVEDRYGENSEYCVVRNTWGGYLDGSNGLKGCSARCGYFQNGRSNVLGFRIALVPIIKTYDVEELICHT